jgi:Tol biopolymer transport system component
MEIRMRASIPGLILVFFGICSPIVAQQTASEGAFVTMVTAMDWSPDGHDLLLKIVRFDKNRRVEPLIKTFMFGLESGRFDTLYREGNGGAVSPDGRSVAFFRQNRAGKPDVLLYELATRRETLLLRDTFGKFNLSWSPDGKKLAYNIETNGKGRDATLEICIFDLQTKSVNQITESGKYKSYNPVWSPDGKKIVYYFEKGDNRDQIYLTDARGSFHTNLTRDTTTHNFYPSWVNNKTIIYTQGPDQIMMMRVDGEGRKPVREIRSFLVKYNPATKRAAYVTRQPKSELMLFDWKTRTSTVLLSEEALKALLPGH